LDLKSTPSFAEAFGKPSDEADSSSAPFVILFDRSRFEFHQMGQKEVESLFNEHLGKGKLEVATSLIAKYFKSRSRYRFERVHSVPMFITPTFWMKITSWKAIVSYMGFIGVIYAVMRLINRIKSSAPKAADPKKKPKAEEPKDDKGTKQEPQKDHKRDGDPKSKSSTSSSGTDTSSSSESVTENYGENEDTSSKPPKRSQQRQSESTSSKPEKKTESSANSSAASSSEESENESEEASSSRSASSGEESDPDNEDADADDDDQSLRQLVQKNGWLDMTKTKISSLKHALVFIYFSKTESVASADLASFADCAASFSKDPLHFGVHIGDSNLRSFVREHCNTDDSAQLGGLALHARRGKYVLFYGKISSLKEWISKLLEGSLRFSQLSSELSWPNVDSNHASS
jgi:hypothetical protein